MENKSQTGINKFKQKTNKRSLAVNSNLLISLNNAERKKKTIEKWELKGVVFIPAEFFHSYRKIHALESY